MTPLDLPPRSHPGPLPHPGTPSLDATATPRAAEGIGVVLVNYATEPVTLERTLAALAASTGVGAGDATPLVDILVLDNASPRWQLEGRAIADRLGVRWADAGGNYGFAGGVNRAVARLDPRATLVFLCNPDATVEPDALARLARVLAGQPRSCVAAAPKMLLDRPGCEGPAVLDAVGNAVNERAEAFNVGLGQPDLGQYDRPAPCFGPCFGAALIRRDAFDPSMVGPLDESLFLYYEDVDWNWRAQLLGFDAVTVPDARVHHTMSITMRDRPYGDKFELTERNLMICALKNFRAEHALRVVGRRSLGLLKGSLTGRHYPLPGLRALAGVAIRLPGLLRSRRAVQARRVRPDAAVTSYAVGERTFFDAVRYVPTEPDAADAFARARLSRTG